MRLAWLLVVVPLSAQADLYRWVDPATGSVKYSSLPPADPRIEAEVVRYKAPPAPKAAATPPKTTTSNTSVAELETRWRSLGAEIAAIPAPELRSGSDRLRQQVQAYETARAELDRLDPGGAARRNAETAALMQRLARTQ